YQNGPLPTWIGWYAQHLPHRFHVFPAAATLVLELGLVWMMFMPRRWRIICFFIATIWQIGVILSANYTFLNYLVLVLGFLLLDDKFLLRYMPRRWRDRIVVQAADIGEQATPRVRSHWGALKLATSAVMLTWIFYATTAQMIWM